MTAHEIIAMYLKERVGSYDGLVNPGYCACTPDDIAPCGSIEGSCEPGHKVEFPNGDCASDDCPADGECDWHMHPGGKP